MNSKKKICVIIPCYKVKNEILSVINKINFNIINKVILVDDCCPENTGTFVKKLKIKKVKVIILKRNLGVGGATLKGFSLGIKEKFDILFKIDGDGQHEPKDISKFLNKLKKKDVNFCKGTRFKNSYNIRKIPKIRLIGNIFLTFLTKINCRNFNFTDAVNGYLAIKSSLLRKLNFSKISNDFFFEEDLIFQISHFEKNINEVQIKTIYKNKSSLKPIKIILPFFFKHLRNFFRRAVYDLSK